ncbi:MAG: OPT/YSL family transporter [Promethearchaeota archaeon]
MAILLGPNFSLGLIFGLLFPIHMLIPLALGGLIRFILDKKKDPNVVADKGMLVVTALSAGGSIAIFPIILLAILV